MNEIDEFYSYVEAPQVEENMKSWESYFTQRTPNAHTLGSLPLTFACRMDKVTSRHSDVAYRISTRKSGA